jgi:hypothetical protein
MLKPSLAEIEAKIEVAKKEAEDFSKKDYGHKIVEHSWRLIQASSSGINSNLYYRFNKKLQNIIPIEFSNKYQEFKGFAYSMEYATGFRSNRQKDIHEYGLTFHAVVAQTNGTFFGTELRNHIKNLSPFAKQFKKAGVDLLNLPDITNFLKYPREIEELKKLQQEKRLNQLTKERLQQIDLRIREIEKQHV